MSSMGMPSIDEALDMIREKLDDADMLEFLEKAGRFHGHLCPGLAIGVGASRIALEDSARARDEEMVAVVENDACGVDAVQALTGCTYGKGNLIHLDHGKQIFIFHSRSDGKALRLSLRPDALGENRSERSSELFSKVREGTASPEETSEFWRGHIERTAEVLNRGRSIFDIKEIDAEPPEKARIFDSVICDECGEAAMSTRIVDRGGRKLCIPCAGGGI